MDQKDNMSKQKVLLIWPLLDVCILGGKGSRPQPLQDGFVPSSHRSRWPGPSREGRGGWESHVLFYPRLVVGGWPLMFLMLRKKRFGTLSFP